MNDDQHTNIDQDITPKKRLGGLDNDRQTAAQNINLGYSRFIKRVKFALPLMALLLIALLFGWNSFEGNKIIPINEQDVQPKIKQEIGKNELINPKFESIDAKGQPFRLTADKAVQENKGESDMFLDNPSGIIDLNSGENFSVKSNSGIYRQLEETLDLSDNVILSHSQGYDLYTDVLHVDMAANKAWSKHPVRVTGPEGNIQAQGIQASAQSETVIFTGPAKMLLNIEDNAIGLGAASP